MLAYKLEVMLLILAKEAECISRVKKHLFSKVEFLVSAMKYIANLSAVQMDEV